MVPCATVTVNGASTETPVLPNAGVALTAATGAGVVLVAGTLEVVGAVGSVGLAGSVVGAVGSDGSVGEDCWPESPVGVSDGTVTGPVSALLPVAPPEPEPGPVELCTADPSPPPGSAWPEVHAVSANSTVSIPASAAGTRRRRRGARSSGPDAHSA
jgi:hypothetical protein